MNLRRVKRISDTPCRGGEDRVTSIDHVRMSGMRAFVRVKGIR